MSKREPESRPGHGTFAEKTTPGNSSALYQEGYDSFNYKDYCII